MPKSLIVYFSQGMTTAQVAERIAAGLRSDYQVDLCNIKDTQPPLVKDYDLVGIGLPAYFFRPPFNVLDYVNSLPDLSGIPVFVFVLFGSIMGSAGNDIRHILSRKGAKDAGYFRCFGADYYLGYLLEGYFLSPEHPTKEELGQAEDFGREVARRVSKKEFTKQAEDSALSLLVYRIEYLLTCRLFVRLMYSWMFWLKKEKCNSCGICIKNCPVGNIKADKNARPTWGRNCILCLHCDMKCPQEAIMSVVKLLPLFRLFHIYNIRQALRNPAISYVRAIVKAGKVEKLNT